MVPPTNDNLYLRVRASYGDLQTATENFKKAHAMARELNDLFQRPNAIAITGGTVSAKVPEQYREEALSPIDACAIDGRCNQWGHPALPMISIPHFKAIYDGPTDKLVSAVEDKDVYGGGATIANPWARIVFTDIEPEEINTVSVRDMIEKRRYPFTFSLEPLNDRDLLGMSPEEVVRFLDGQETVYRTGAETYRKESKRPRWNVELNNDKKKAITTFEKILIPSRTDSRGYEELKDEKRIGLNRMYNPVGNETDWIVDYGIVGKHKHPLKDNRIAFGSYGAHGLATFGGETLPRLTEFIPSDNAHILNNVELLATMRDMIRGEKIDQYQALICTTKTPVGGTVIPPTLLAETSGKEIAIQPGMNYGYTLYTNNMIMLGIIE